MVVVPRDGFTVIFEGWLTDHFLLKTVRAHSQLLLLDGHYQPKLVQLAKEHDMIILFPTTYYP